MSADVVAGVEVFVMSSNVFRFADGVPQRDRTKFPIKPVSERVAKQREVDAYFKAATRGFTRMLKMSPQLSTEGTKALAENAKAIAEVVESAVDVAEHWLIPPAAQRRGH